MAELEGGDVVEAELVGGDVLQFSLFGVVGLDLTAEHHARVPIEVGAQPSTAVRGRAGRCLEAGEQSSVGLLDAVLWCLLTIRADTGMDIEVPHGRTVQQLSAGPAGHLGSWAKVYSSQLGQGTGPAAILGPG